MFLIKTAVQQDMTRYFHGDVRNYLDGTFQADGYEEDELPSSSHIKLSLT